MEGKSQEVDCFKLVTIKNLKKKTLKDAFFAVVVLFCFCFLLLFFFQLENETHFRIDPYVIEHERTIGLYHFASRIIEN